MGTMPSATRDSSTSFSAVEVAIDVCDFHVSPPAECAAARARRDLRIRRRAVGTPGRPSAPADPRAVCEFPDRTDASRPQGTIRKCSVDSVRGYGRRTRRRGAHCGQERWVRDRNSGQSATAGGGHADSGSSSRWRGAGSPPATVRASDRAMLIGRSAQTDAIDGLMADARAGRSGVLSFVGKRAWERRRCSRRRALPRTG